ncbi:hypothetical protein [Buttiauxella sp. BIGb0552]|uniref:hypothetical protein n=1 Tax=Buttiauxella sp. BIGb0552 TaxID=2485120 RepID=UPI001FBA9B66|nr:hypothetical protein [Buttiauxella sp. BIGb0552]
MMSEQVNTASVQSYATDFGFYPVYLHIRTKTFTVETIPDFKSVIKSVKDNPYVDKSWIYAPPQESYDLRGIVATKPYSGRVFSLPKTHTLKLSGAFNRDDHNFVIWCLSFFSGMRLTTTQAGFLDATPIKPGTLIDFCLSGSDELNVIQLALNYIGKKDLHPLACMRIAAVIHALFLAQRPQNLAYEKFQYLYMALDGCFSIKWDERDLTKKLKKPKHFERVLWMCNEFKMPVPFWAEGEANIASIRNDNFHEGIFFGQPLGFSAYKSDHSGALTSGILVQIEALICRFLVVLLGVSDLNYISSALNTREYYPLKLN